MTSKQFIVATSTRDISRKSSQITRCLEGYPEGLTPKLISLKTGLNINTVKSILPRMKDIEKPIRGLYKVVKVGDTPPLFPVELSDWNFHNLVLRTDLVTGVGKLVQEDFDWGLVHGVFSISKDGSAVLRVDTDFPINVSSLCLLHTIFNNVLLRFKLPEVESSDLMVSTIEFNRDFKNLRLDGVQSVSLDNLVEQFKVYQKSIGLRLEHKTKVPLSVDSIIDMLSNNPNSVEFHVKLNEQKLLIDRLAKASVTTTQLLYKVIDTLGGKQ